MADTPKKSRPVPARPAARSARSAAASESAGEAVEGEVLTPVQKLADRQAKNHEAGLTSRRAPRGAAAARAAAKKPRALGLDPIEVEYDGFIYSVDPSILDDWTLLEQEAEGVLEEMSLPDQLRAMLGEDGYTELKENVKEKHGYYSGRVIAGFSQAVQEQVQEGNF